MLPTHILITCSVTSSLDRNGKTRKRSDCFKLNQHPLFSFDVIDLNKAHIAPFFIVQYQYDGNLVPHNGIDLLKDFLIKEVKKCD